MASEIRVNQIQNRSGLTTTTFTDTGVTIAGILTVSENLNVGGVLTYEDVTNIDSVGVVTARAGINLVGNDLNVGSNIKIGNASGIVTATSFVGSGANLTGITGTTINTNADNRIITGSGTANTLNGEANLTFDGTNLDLGDSKKIRIGDSQDLELFHNGANSGIINSQGALYITNDATNSSDVHIRGKSSIKLHCPADGDVRIFIKSNGDIGFNDTSPTAHASGNNTVLSIKGKGSSYSGKIDFKDSSGNLDNYINSDNAVFQFNCDPNSQNGNTAMRFFVHGSERVRITSGGHISQGGGAEPSSTNGSIGLKHGIKSTANNVIIGETTQTGSGYGLHIESRQTGRSGSARIAQIGLKNDASGNGQISFFTSPSGADVSERMVINSSGYVTKPNHPSFCARHQGSDGFSGDIIVLTRISTSWDVWNTGNHYSTSTGKFTAPVDGIYYFEGQLMTTGHNNGDNIQDMMSLESSRGRITYCRQRKSYFRSDEDANGYYTNSTGSSVRLDAGDTVWFQRKSGHSWSYSNRYYSYFTGWLIG